jgi:tRNA A37 methylthiotransferase MiaB
MGAKSPEGAYGGEAPDQLTRIRNTLKTTGSSSLRIVMIKPSLYDEEGYVVRFWRDYNPNYVLAAIHGILLEAASRGVPVVGVDLEIMPLDESSQPVHSHRLISWLREGERGLVMLVGVQTSLYPRAVDLGRQFTDNDIPVIMGGFHISGCQVKTPNWSPCLQAAREAGIALFAGELEGGAVDALLRDAWEDRLQRFYNHLATPPSLQDAPRPHIDKQVMSTRTMPIFGLELGRGCPYTCTFCSVISVFGHKMRARKTEDLAVYLQQCAAYGPFRLMIVDDNLARNPAWRTLFPLLERLRDQGMEMAWYMQVDNRSHRIPGFVAGAARAGCTRVFIGVESMREENLRQSDKRACPVEALRTMALAWKRVGIMVCGGYIIGFPDDTPERVAEDIRTLQDRTAIDGVHISILTPLPGSEDHRLLVERGEKMDADFNRFEASHAVMSHPRMSQAELEQLHDDTWRRLFSYRFIYRSFKRALVTRLPMDEVFGFQLIFSGSLRIEKLPPYQSGLLRLKDRHARRPGYPVEPAWRFFGKHFQEILTSQMLWGLHFLCLHLLLLLARLDLRLRDYTDPTLED